MKTKIISYFCDVDPNDTYYSDHAEKFIENMKNLGMAYYVEHIRSRGSYRANCLFKPKFILKCIENNDCPILWLDIDSYVFKKLDMFENLNCDIALACNYIEETGKNIPKASPIFLNKTENSINFVKKWIEKCDHYLKNENKFFDHEVMLEVLEEVKLNVHCVGSNYCLFADTNYNKDEAVIAMGISDGISKTKSLKDMGLSEIEIIGNTSRVTFYTNNGSIL